MTVWAIADLHLSFGVPDKAMDVFGEQWIGYTKKVEQHWKSLIQPDDLVLIAGDISWAMKVEEAKPDLEWIHALPGCKVLIRGNHDYWWESLKKIAKVLPPSMHLIQNNAFNWQHVSVAGTRLWDTPEYSFAAYVDYKHNARAKISSEKNFAADGGGDEAERLEDERLFARELARLEMSLKCLDKKATKRIAMIHYPPIGAQLYPSRTSALLEKYRVDVCVFGHLHNIKPGIALFGESRGVAYHLTSCDYLNFTPIKVCD